MKAGLLNKRITIQKSETVVDEACNHLPDWKPYFQCWATVTNGSRVADETHNAGTTQEHSRLDITVRWCDKIAAVNSTEYRILIGEDIYNILSIDEMGFRRFGRKFHTERKER